MMACRLKGQALAVYLLIVHHATLAHKSRVKLKQKFLAAAGITRDQRRLAYSELETVGLIRVHLCGPGKASEVELLMPQPEPRDPIRHLLD
jgi:hypothetical protein